MPPRVALGWHKLGAFGGTWLKTNAIFGSLEGEKSRGERRVEGRRIVGNGYLPPYLNIFKIK